MRKTVLTAAILLLSACNASGDDAAAPAEAEATATSDAGAAEPTAPTTPATKEAAVALMKERHENFEKIGDAFKVVMKELKGDTPDVAKVQAGAATIASLAPQVPSWFPAGTGPDVGKTEAKAEIWEKPEDFAAKALAFQQAATAFDTAAKGGDLTSMRAAQAELGKSCKGCHDLYREEE